MCCAEEGVGKLIYQYLIHDSIHSHDPSPTCFRHLVCLACHPFLHPSVRDVFHSHTQACYSISVKSHMREISTICVWRACQAHELIHDVLRGTRTDNGNIWHATGRQYHRAEGCFAVGGKEDYTRCLPVSPRAASIVLSRKRAHVTAHVSGERREQHMSRQSRERAHVTAHAG